MHLYGLIGFPLSHSFSQRYFTGKFEREGLLDCRYELFPLENIAALPALLASHPELRGLNVTIPYKTAVIPYLDALDATAEAVGAVNTIDIRDGQLTGYNTDVHGFLESLLRMAAAAGYCDPPRGEALILGHGGAALAVAWVLRQLSIPYRFVVRRPQDAVEIGYPELRELDFGQIRWIINTTPVGTYPHAEGCPDLPFDKLITQHFVYDLIYNPPETLLLQRAKAQGCHVKNGLEMLHLQAEKAWAIWQSP
jgi:shikimate dehydrogenase